jgi:hypothetical protein
VAAHAGAVVCPRSRLTGMSMHARSLAGVGVVVRSADGLVRIDPARAPQDLYPATAALLARLYPA